MTGVKLVISDAHKGSTAAVRKVLKAEWQRCKVHFYRNVLVHVPKRSQTEVSEAMKAVFVQRDKKSAETKAADLVRQFQARFAKAMEIFEAGIDDVLSYLHYPQSHRTRISSTNPLERLNLEIRRRTRVVGVSDLRRCTRGRLRGEGCVHGGGSIRKESLIYCGDSLSPRPWDFSLSRQNGSLACGATGAAPSHSGP